MTVVCLLRLRPYLHPRVAFRSIAAQHVSTCACEVYILALRYVRCCWLPTKLIQRKKFESVITTNGCLILVRIESCSPVADPENFGGGMIKILSTKPQKFGCVVTRRVARNLQWIGCFRGLGQRPSRTEVWYTVKESYSQHIYVETFRNQLNQCYSNLNYQYPSEILSEYMVFSCY